MNATNLIKNSNRNSSIFFNYISIQFPKHVRIAFIEFTLQFDMSARFETGVVKSFKKSQWCFNHSEPCRTFFRAQSTCIMFLEENEYLILCALRNIDEIISQECLITSSFAITQLLIMRLLCLPAAIS